MSDCRKVMDTCLKAVAEEEVRKRDERIALEKACLKLLKPKFEALGLDGDHPVTFKDRPRSQYASPFIHNLLYGETDICGIQCYIEYTQLITYGGSEKVASIYFTSKLTYGELVTPISLGQTLLRRDTDKKVDALVAELPLKRKRRFFG